MLQTERCLDQPGDARSRFQMTDVALDRADHAAVVGLACLAVDRPDRGSLDRVADRRSGAVRLHVLHAFRRDVGQPQGIAHICFLRRPGSEPRCLPCGHLDSPPSRE